jgi:hypothetical protein
MVGLLSSLVVGHWLVVYAAEPLRVMREEDPEKDCISVRNRALKERGKDGAAEECG